MQVIQRLPIHLSNQIAAGEVVQRPASVVKELLENAIDAGATEIAVHIKDGGRTLISITDNGSGMHPADAELCFERHATSKINSIDDLFKLSTMGFRGEALASIGAVAQVDLKTKTQARHTGIHIRHEAGKIVQKEEIVCGKGTLIEVKNLFFNIPARRNFLKSDGIEFNHIEDAFLYVALAHSEVAFVLHHNNQPVYNLEISNLKKRVSDVLGKGGADKLFPISSETDIVTIHGYLGKPETARKTRGNQFFFVNRRFFKSSYFHHAVQAAFEGLIPEKTFPSYYIFFEINPSKIDVNIHPTKTEIKFDEERFIYSLLLSTIRESLGRYNLMPTLDFDKETAFDLPPSFRHQPVQAPVIRVDPNYNPFAQESKTEKAYSSAIHQQGFSSTSTQEKEWTALYQIIEQPNAAAPLFHENDGVTQDFLVVGKYILTPVRSGVMVIDIKRALERILYDESITAFVKQPLQVQTLLFPIEKKLEHQEQRIMRSHQKVFEQLGFKLEINEDVLKIEGVPAMLHEEGILTCFDALMERMEHQDQQQEDLAHLLLSELVKNAARYHKFTHKSEMQLIIDKLFSCKEHQVSPNNERIMATLDLNDITSLFR